MKKTIQLLVLLIFTTTTFAQEPNDCINAITICGNGVFTSNASGIGFVQEVSGCTGYEHNSIWLKVNVAQSGTLGFNIIPLNTDIAVDYDFWVYPANASCGALGSPIRCCTTNPNLAGLTSNVTGMNGSTLLINSGPGANGNGYVRWLTVTAGQSYYIAIDRPVGDGGFELQWTGTALLASSAVANTIPDYIVCSQVSNIGIFDLDTRQVQINADLVANTVSFFTTLADAVDNVSALPNIVQNQTNPQLIYARVTNNASGCFAISQFNLVVTPCMGIDSVTNDFKVSAYPNPFETDFIIEVTTKNTELVKIKVHDMLGKLVEERIINPSKVVSQKIGQKYATGIYSVTVTQENETMKFKLVKR